MMYRKYESSTSTPAPVASPDQLARSTAMRNAKPLDAITEFMYTKPVVASTATMSVTATITGCLLLGIPARSDGALVAKSQRAFRCCFESQRRPKSPTRHSGATAASGGGGGATSPTTCSSSARARPALTRRSLRASLTSSTRTHPECRCHRRSRPSASPVARCHPPPTVRPSSRATSSPPRLAAWHT